MTRLGQHGMWARTAPLVGGALAAAMVAGGCGSPGDEPSQRAATAPATTTTQAPARTTTTPRSTPSTGRPTATVTTQATTTPRSGDKPGARSPGAAKTKTTTTPAPATKFPPARAKVGTPQTFRGDGDRVIGSLALERNAVVRWTVAGGGEFSVRDAGGRLKISGRGPSGQSFAASGDYRSVKVTAGGRWTLSFASLGD